jgi:putative heme transporter
MFIYTIVFNLVQGNIVTPLVYSRTVSLHPAVVLLSIPAGAALAGIAGMFLIVPILAVVKTTWSSVVLLLGDTPPAPPPVSVEQPDEAAAAVLVPKPAD